MAEHAAQETGDAWATGPDGTRMWGLYGAAGLLAHDPKRGVLLQHRAEWSHHGGTWGIPGGALRPDELPVAGALREAHEEAAVPSEALDPLFTRVLDLGFWSYTTFAVEVHKPFEADTSDAETAGISWCPPDEVSGFPLHPAFAESWPALASLLAARPLLIIDAANVVGSRPDGWWRDRAGAAARLIRRAAGLVERGLPAQTFGVDAQTVWPWLTVVLEGAAKPAIQRAQPEPGTLASRRFTLTAAAGSGDEAIVGETRAALAAHPQRSVLVATSDRELRDRIVEAGGQVMGAGAMLALLDGE